MALNSGVLTLTIEYAKDLKDRDWFCRQDPYCVVQVGQHTRRSKTAKNGCRNPVWHETFVLNLINENGVEIEIKDDNILSDEYIGSCTFALTKARETGSDFPNVPVMSKRSGKQHGLISVVLRWTPNNVPAEVVTPVAPVAAAASTAAPAAAALVVNGPPPASAILCPQLLGPPPMEPSSASSAYAQPQQPQQFLQSSPYPTSMPSCAPAAGPQYAQPYGFVPAVQQPYTANYMGMAAPAAGVAATAMPRYMVGAAAPPARPMAPTFVVVDSDDFPFRHHHHHHHRHHHHRRRSSDDRVIIIEEVL